MSPYEWRGGAAKLKMTNNNQFQSAYFDQDNSLVKKIMIWVACLSDGSLSLSFHKWRMNHHHWITRHFDFCLFV